MILFRITYIFRERIYVMHFFYGMTEVYQYGGDASVTHLTF